MSNRPFEWTRKIVLISVNLLVNQNAVSQTNEQFNCATGKQEDVGKMQLTNGECSSLNFVKDKDKTFVSNNIFFNDYTVLKMF